MGSSHVGAGIRIYGICPRVKLRRKSEYKEWKKRVRELIEESKRRVDEEFGKKLSQNFRENKKLFWKEVKKEWGCEDEGRGWRTFGG